MLVARSAFASCSVIAGSPATFGTVTSFVIRNAIQQTSSNNSGLSCSGALLSLLRSGDQINLNITSANGSELVGPSGDKIGYTIFADSGRTIPLSPGTTYNYASGQLLNLLGIFGGPGTTLPVYFSTSIGSNVAAGTYADTLTLHWNWNYCSGIGVLGVCIGRDISAGNATVTVSVSVTNDCTITAPDINFGAAPLVFSFSPVNQSLSLICTKGMTYTVGLSSGANVAANGRRQMASGSNRLQYDIFSAGATVWGSATNRVASVGSADGLSNQSFGYTARIYTDQPTPPLGSYTDSLVVDVRY
jgi:spore coat protein U-like protein